MTWNSLQKRGTLAAIILWSAQLTAVGSYVTMYLSTINTHYFWVQAGIPNMAATLQVSDRSEQKKNFFFLFFGGGGHFGIFAHSPLAM